MASISSASAARSYLHQRHVRRVCSPASEIPKTRASCGQPARHGGGHPPQATREHAGVYVATSQGTESVDAFGALVGGLGVEEGAVKNKVEEEAVEKRRVWSALPWEEGLAHNATPQTNEKKCSSTFLKNFMYTTTPRPPKTIGERN
jgi:hypothetical protein